MFDLCYDDCSEKSATRFGVELRHKCDVDDSNQLGHELRRNDVITQSITTAQVAAKAQSTSAFVPQGHFGV